MKIKLAANIRTFRKEQRMTQEQLAEALGVTVGAVHKWEKDLSTPDLSLILAMADLFGTSTDVLLGYEWQNGNAGDSIQKIQQLIQKNDFEDAVTEAEKATKTVLSELIDWVNMFCQIGINLVIGILSINGIIIQTAIMGGGNLVGTVSGGLSTIAQLFLSTKASKPYFEQIEVRADASTNQPVSCDNAVRNAIVVENLNFAYGEKPVLANANFRFEKGGKYALTGPSGCGKSTLLKLLLGWLPDYTGTIRFDEKNVKDFTGEQLHQQMSYIEQNVFLFNTTIRDNITLGENFTDELIDRAVRESALAGDLAHMLLGLDTPVGEDGSNLSGGQKQRVAIARALIHNRSILLVDEGTSALDQKNADIVEESLLQNPN